SNQLDVLSQRLRSVPLLSAKPARCGWMSRAFAAVLRSRLSPPEGAHPVLVIPSLFVLWTRCAGQPGKKRKSTAPSHRCSHDHTQYRGFLRSGHSASRQGGCRGTLRIKTTGLFPSCEWPLTALSCLWMTGRRMGEDAPQPTFEAAPRMHRVWVGNRP